MQYVVMLGAFALLALLLASAPLLVSIIGWGLGRHRYIEIAIKAAPLITLVVTVGLTIGSVGVAAFVAYANWLSPFRPMVPQIRPVLLLLGPAI